MTINQELVVYDAALRADSTLHDQMIEHGGVSAPVRHLAGADVPDEYFSEAISAMVQETIVMLFYDLHRAARRLRPTATLNWSATFSDEIELKSIPAKMVLTAKALSDDAIFVVSPTVLTIVQSAGALQRVENMRRDENEYSISGHRVFIDPYADDQAAIIVAQRGWFHFSNGSIHSDGLMMKNDIVTSLVPDRIAIIDLVQ
jgi:hypothetical protein